MKKFFLILGTLLLLVAIITFTLLNKQDRGAKEIALPESKGTALVITGAAARIPQEAALLEQLYYTGELTDIEFISGTSSGAINAIMLNAILSGKYSWDQYRELLFSMNNQSIFVASAKSLPVNTEPMRQLFTRVLHDTLGYFTIGDLPIPTSLSAVSLSLASIADMTYRFSNLKINAESNPDLDLVEILMASTAFPIAFPPAQITRGGKVISGKFIDGGTTADYIPFRAVLEFEKFVGYHVKRMIIVSRKLDTEEGLRKELMEMGIEGFDLLNRFNITLEDLGQRSFSKGLEAIVSEAPLLSGRTYVYLPAIPGEYPLFDFNNLRAQYEASREWARNHEPILLETVLREGIPIDE